MYLRKSKITDLKNYSKKYKYTKKKLFNYRNVSKYNLLVSTPDSRAVNPVTPLVKLQYLWPSYLHNHWVLLFSLTILLNSTFVCKSHLLAMNSHNLSRFPSNNICLFHQTGSIRYVKCLLHFFCCYQNRIELRLNRITFLIPDCYYFVTAVEDLQKRKKKHTVHNINRKQDIYAMYIHSANYTINNNNLYNYTRNNPFQ